MNSTNNHLHLNAENSKPQTSQLIVHSHRYSYAQVQSKLKLFCERSSIRGVQRIINSKLPSIRILWSIFVVSMTCVLAVSSGFLISDYLTYSTAWYTLSLRDDRPEFPAITLCAHNPFSLKVNHLWKLKNVSNPNQVKSRLKQLITTMLDNQILDFTGDLAFSDSIEFYYTNIDTVDSYQMGHGKNMFYHCMVYEEDSTVVAEKCDLELETSIQLRRFSHPKYFNCWTIEGKSNASTSSITRLVILARLVPLKKIDGARELFVMDSFTRGEGIKIIVHERGTYPEIDKHGVNVQPGRMNEINYETLLWKRLSTPVLQCSDQQKPIEDLGIYYTYEQNQCINRILQTRLIDKCKCLNSEWPRTLDYFNQTNVTIPYCQRLPNNSTVKSGAIQMQQRLHCLSQLLFEAQKLKNEIVQSRQCIPRCTSFKYNTKLSVTLWDPDPYKLDLYTKNYRQVDKFLQNPTERSHLNNLLNHFTETDDKHTKVSSKLQNGSFDEIFDDGTHTYISLIRQDFDTTLKEERLVFDIYILLSRIGGLCSLCIGLTTEFVMEIVEFTYLLCRKKFKQKRHPVELKSQIDSS